jgi:uncharacterized delta-60 repeat protein
MVHIPTCEGNGRLRRTLRAALTTGLVATAVVAFAPGDAGAGPGELDPSFSSELSFTSYASDVVAQADGRLLVTTPGLSVHRLLPSGALDPTFGTSGTTAVTFGGGGDVRDLVVQSNGRIVAAELGATSVHVLHLLPNGALDPSFDGDGVQSAPVPCLLRQDPYRCTFSDLAIQPDGQIVLVGTQLMNVFGNHGVMTRINLSGTTDLGFGSGGVVTLFSPEAETRFRAVRIQPDGTIVVGGLRGAPGASDMLLARYTSGGVLGTSFGSGIGSTTGVVIGSYASEVSTLEIMADGRIVAGSRVVTGVDPTFGSVWRTVFARYLSNGALDPTFGSGGVSLVTISPVSNVVDAMAVAPDGTIYASGTCCGPTGSSYRLFLTRVLPNGAPDPYFADGAGSLIFFSGVDNRLALQPDGLLVSTRLGGTMHRWLTAPDPPGAPTAVRVTLLGTTATVSWTAPADTGGGPITGYTVTADPGDVSCATTSTTCALVGLGPGTEYVITVTAANSSGTGAAATALLTVPPAPSPPVEPPTQPPVTPPAGYWLLQDDGTVYGFGAALAGDPVGLPSVAIEHAPHGGYWVVGADGSVHGRHGAPHHGDATGAVCPGEHVASLSALPDGSGYWVFTDQGRAIPFGAAAWYGDMSAVVLNGPIVASVATPSGHGYYMIASDGGVFAFGDAVFRGSTGALRLNQPVVGIAPDPDGSGYWLVASDGGIFAFDAVFHGSMGGTVINQAVVGAVAYGVGYLMVAADGGIFAFSDTPFLGSLGSDAPATPIVDVTVYAA